MRKYTIHTCRIQRAHVSFIRAETLVLGVVHGHSTLGLLLAVGSNVEEHPIESTSPYFALMKAPYYVVHSMASSKCGAVFTLRMSPCPLLYMQSVLIV